MPFIPVSSFQWERQSDNRQCWPDVWGWRLSRQQRGCLHSFRNSFHSRPSQTLDDINIMCLVINCALGASGISDCMSQECGLPNLHTGCEVSPLSSAPSQPQLGSELIHPPKITMGWRKLRSQVRALAQGGWALPCLGAS